MSLLEEYNEILRQEAMRQWAKMTDEEKRKYLLLVEEDRTKEQNT